MEPHRRPSGRRILLPAEVDLCAAVGLTEDEYWHFVGLTESYNGQRAKAYDLIPNIVCDPTGGILTNLVIGVALSFVASALTPKPKPPKFDSKTPPSMKTTDATGARRFSPQAGFDSVQDLASLGEIVPLVFANRNEDLNIGGIRINGKLLWSQMRSLNISQQLRAVFLLSYQDLGAEPDFSGYAIGDTTLANYTNAKVALYFRDKPIAGRAGNVNRFVTGDRYPEGTLSYRLGTTDSIISDWPGSDPFTVYSDLDQTYKVLFSGTRTPRTQSVFGTFAPMANGSVFMLPFELVLIGVDSTKKADARRKRKKLRTKYPRHASITKLHQSGQVYTWGVRTAQEDDLIDYTLFDNDPTKEIDNYLHDMNSKVDQNFEPYGAEDIKSAIDSDRERSDDNISIGDMYMFGTCLVVCTKRSRSIWKAGEKKEMQFKVIEPGAVEIVGKSTGAMIWDHDTYQTFQPWEVLVPQRVAVATITNTRACSTTEIGIKSTVWGQITGFANVNSHPGWWEMNDKFNYINNPDTKKSVIRSYESANGSIQLGNMSKYIKRLSFFRLQARRLGRQPKDDWTFIDGGIPFCVKGRSPQPQYNFLRINHAPGQWEFRLLPWPGNKVKRDRLNKEVYLLRADQHLQNIESNYTGFSVYYGGTRLVLTPNECSNPEWWIGEQEESETEGAVRQLEEWGTGPTQMEQGWIFETELKYTTRNNRGSQTTQTGVRMELHGHRPTRYNLSYYDTHQNSSNTTGMSAKNKQITSNEYSKYVRHSESDPIPTHFYDNPAYAVENGGKQYRVGQYNAGWQGFATWDIRRYTYGEIESAFQSSVISPTGGSGTGLKIKCKVYTVSKIVRWEIEEGGSGYKTGEEVSIPVNFNGVNETYRINIATETGNLNTPAWPDGQNLNPYDALADFVKYDAHITSHQDGPEHQVAYVNEYLQTPDIPYSDLAIAGIHMNSSKEWSSFSQLSAYIKKGIKILNLRNLPANVTQSSNLFPDIAYALLTDSSIGCGELVGTEGVDQDRMKIASEFCHANGFFWDGVIVASQNIRDFIFEQSSFFLLDFTILGGQFSLYPSVPFDPINYEIDGSATPDVKALFTDGNIRDLKVSFLTPEERQLFTAKVLYRVEEPNGFPTTETFGIRLKGLQDNSYAQSIAGAIGGTEQDPIETFDMTNFCTSKEAAVKFAKYALRMRQLVDHGVTFQTTPQAAMGLIPGQYFRLFSTSTHTSRFQNGSIDSEGNIICVEQNVASLQGQPIYYWDSEQDGVKEGVIDLVAGGKNRGLYNKIFTVKQANTSDRIYKVETLTYDQDGFIEISGSHVPLTSTGGVGVLNWLEDDFMML